MPNAETLLSIVVPAYNEAQVLPEFHRRLAAVLDGLDLRGEIVYVNDGSSDATLDVMHALKQQDPRVALIDLSRNFGKEIAMTAGLDHARGDAVVVIDADLQDPPELIPELVRVWREGYDVAYAKRTAREGESWLKRATARAFYGVIQHVGRVRIPENTGDFRLLSRRAVDALGQLREQHRFMKGLFAWIGFPQKAVPYVRQPRHAGHTKWNYWRLWNFALDGITSFSIAPLKIATYLGFVLALAAFVYGSWIILKTLAFGDPVPGYPSLMTMILFLGGVQLLFIGVLGEYLGRMFDESKRRPLYLINAYEPADVTRED
ncbi:MAG: glycosyltransferase family 2 protein [Chromatiales bacterium]|jgi:glycosyltransferase involved in cell wall biosynthesis|nr:glycosyltransferase family 2 protein [Chromatiales bacterium]MDX9768247.1 glycosyltransferase family 2 protein [Ectothiorhodospiraceae bacterium]